jgi:hypothetical protein
VKALSQSLYLQNLFRVSKSTGIKQGALSFKVQIFVLHQTTPVLNIYTLSSAINPNNNFNKYSRHSTNSQLAKHHRPLHIHLPLFKLTYPSTCVLESNTTGSYADMTHMARWFGATEPTQSADRVAGTGSERKVSVSEMTCVLCIAEVACWVVSFWSFCVFWEMCMIFG